MIATAYGHLWIRYPTTCLINPSDFGLPGKFSRSEFVPLKQHLPRRSLHIPLPNCSALLQPNKGEINLERIIVLRPVEVRGLEENFPPWMVPSSKLTYLSPRHFCTWFSYFRTVKYVSFLEGIYSIQITVTLTIGKCTSSYQRLVWWGKSTFNKSMHWYRWHQQDHLLLF